MVRRKIFESDHSEVSGSSFCKVTGDDKEDSPADKCLNLKSAADYSNATLTENANGNIPFSNDICQADTAATVDINEDHRYAASSARYAKHHCALEDHSYNLGSPRSLKRKNQATEKILTKYRKKLKMQSQKSRRLKKKDLHLKGCH